MIYDYFRLTGNADLYSLFLFVTTMFKISIREGTKFDYP